MTAPPKATPIPTESQPELHEAPGPATSAAPPERTPWLLCFLCLLIPLLPTYVVPAGPLKSNGSPAKVIAVMCFGLVVLAFILIRRAAPTKTLNPGAVILLVFFFIELLVYGVGLSHLGSSQVEATKTRAVIIVIANVGLSLYVMTRAKSLRQRTTVLGCLAVGLAWACVVGLLQNSTSIDLRNVFQPPGFVVNWDYLQLDERLGNKRVVGTSNHAIEFSVLTAIAVPLALHFSRYGGTRQVRWLAGLACLLALAAMPAAVSRSGVVTLGTALLVYMWSCTARQLLNGLILASLAVGAYMIALPNTASALWHAVVDATDDGSVWARVRAYAVVAQNFHDNPIWGFGLGGNPPTEFGYLDNEWLQQLVQGGLVSVTAMMVLSLGAVFGVSAGLRSAKSPRERDQAWAMGAMLMGILSSTVTFDLFTYQQATLVFFILFGMLWSNFTVAVPESSGRRQAAKLPGFG
jgi:O-antigen ligase